MSEDVFPFIIPITIILGAVAIGIVAMVLKHKAKDRMHRERMFMAEKGLEIPSELYEVHEPKKPSEYRIARAWLLVLGVLTATIGVGVGITLTIQEGFDQGIGGLIAVFVGVGFLVAERMIARLVSSKNGNGG